MHSSSSSLMESHLNLTDYKYSANDSVERTPSSTVIEDSIHLMRYSVYDLNPKFSCLPNIKFCTTLEHLISVLEHEYKVCNDDVVFTQIVHSQKSRIEHERNKAICDIQKRKCVLTRNGAEQLRTQWLEELRTCVDESCKQYKNDQSTSKSGSKPQGEEFCKDKKRKLKALLAAIDEKRIMLKRIQSVEVFGFCWKYLEDAIEGLKIQTNSMVSLLEVILEDLKNRIRKVPPTNVITVSELEERFKSFIQRLEGGHEKDSLEEIYDNSNEIKLINLTSSLQNIAETLLDDVNKSIQNCLDAAKKRSHFVVELRKASLNSDLDRAEKVAREFVKARSFELNQEEIETKGVIVSRLRSIDELNQLIYQMELDIQNLRQKHTDAIEELVNKRKTLKTMVGELGKMKQKIEELLSHMKETRNDFDKVKECIEQERERIMNDPNLSNSIRNMLLQQLDQRLIKIEEEHAANDEEISSKLAMLREETIEQQDLITAELLRNINELEEQLLHATESEKLEINAKLEALRSQLKDATEIEIRNVELATVGHSRDEGIDVGAGEEETYPILTGEDEGLPLYETKVSEISPPEFERSETSDSAISSISSEGDSGYAICQELNYTTSAVGKLVVQGLVDCIKKSPADPVAHLSGFIRHRLEVQAKQDRRRKEDEALRKEREKLEALEKAEQALAKITKYPEVEGEDFRGDAKNWEWSIEKLIN